MAAKGTPGSGDYSVGTQGWRLAQGSGGQSTPISTPTNSVTGTVGQHEAEGSTNFNSNYNNPNINNFNRYTYTEGQANNRAEDILQAQGLSMNLGERYQLGMTTGNNAQLSIVDTAEMMHRMHPMSYPTVEYARRFRDDYINPGRAQNPDSYLQVVPRHVAVFQDPDSTMGPSTIMGDPPYTYNPESTAFINIPSPNAVSPFSEQQEGKVQTRRPRPKPSQHLIEALVRDQGFGGRGLDRNSVKQMFLSDIVGLPHEMHHVGNAVDTEALDKSNNKFFLPTWDMQTYNIAQDARVDPQMSPVYRFLPNMRLSAEGRSLYSYNPRFYDTYLSIPNEHAQTLSQLRHYGKGVGIDTFTRNPSDIRQRYADSFAHLVTNNDLSLNQEDRRLQNYADSLLYRAAENNYLNLPSTAQRPTILPRYHYALKDPSAIYRQQTIDFNRKNPDQVQQEAQRFLEPWNNNTLLYTY